jgi:hypothetical protein
MSPEQLRHHVTDRRTDVFALGVVLWEATVGRRLFKRENEFDSMVAIMEEPIPPPSTVQRDYPAALEEIVMRALERDVEHRYPTAAALADDLDRYLADCGVPAGVGQVAELMQSWFDPQGLDEDDDAADEYSSSRSLSDSYVSQPSISASQPKYARSAVWNPPSERPTVSRPVYTAPAAPSRAWIAAIAFALLGVASLVAVAIFPRFGSRGRPATASTHAVTAHASERVADMTPVPASKLEKPPALLEPIALAPIIAPPIGPTNTPHEHHSHDVATDGPPGYLNAIAIPAARVYEGSVLVATTPIMRRPLSPGRHVLRFQRLDGREGTEMRVVRVHSDQTVSVSVRWP